MKIKWWGVIYVPLVCCKDQIRKHLYLKGILPLNICISGQISISWILIFQLFTAAENKDDKMTWLRAAVLVGIIIHKYSGYRAKYLLCFFINNLIMSIFFYSFLYIWSLHTLRVDFECECATNIYCLNII